MAPVAVEYVPKAHATHCADDDNEESDDHEPMGQFKQESTDDDPSAVENEPATHAWHWSEDVAPNTEDHEPAMHAVHVMLLLAPVSLE